MYSLRIGDIVSRKSYGNDIYFIIKNIHYNEDKKPLYILGGILYRVEADSDGSDLVKENPLLARIHVKNYISNAKRTVYAGNLSRGIYNFNTRWEKPGNILHVDSSREFIDICLKHYKQSKITCAGYLADEGKQPDAIRGLLMRYRPDILVITGHDSIKKEHAKPDSISNYRNSGYFIESVREARKYEPSLDKLCIFAGACQSYFEGIMAAGANFASSPGRVLINALDPAIVSEKVALTDTKTIVTPREIADITVTGADGIGGINTKGHLVRG